MSELHVYLKHGWRNLWLYPVRTGLTMAALALGIAALTFLSAMNDGWVQQMKANFTLLLMGHIQIHADEFERSRSLTDRIKDPDLITGQLESEPMVAGWTRRVRVSGLASTAHANAGVRVFAVEPERERLLSHVAGFVKQGRWLTDEDDHAVLLGQELADQLQVDMGSKVVLMVALANGDIASEVFRVCGVLFTGVFDIDRHAAIIPLKTGQRWLDLGESVTDIVVYGHDFTTVPPLISVLQEQYADSDLEVLGWNDIDPMTEQWTQFADVSAWVVLGVVMFVVMAEVLNTMLMSMHERTRELGMMGALGVTHRQIFIMILWETMILVVIGSFIGFGLGAWASIYYGEHGIELSRFATAFSFTYMDSVIRPELSFKSVLNVLGAAVIGALFAGLYPAWRAAKLDPAIAMRNV